MRKIIILFIWIALENINKNTMMMVVINVNITIEFRKLSIIKFYWKCSGLLFFAYDIQVIRSYVLHVNCFESYAVEVEYNIGLLRLVQPFLWDDPKRKAVAKHFFPSLWHSVRTTGA